MLLALLITSPQSKVAPRTGHAKPQQQLPGNGANRFILFVRGAKTLSVHIDLHRPDRPTDGQADLILARPGKLFFHVSWGTEDYTYTVLNGEATEVDRGVKAYDEYPTPGWQAPQANASTWVDSCFPVPFIDESILVPNGNVDGQGHLSAFAFKDGDPPVQTTLKFSDYKTDFAVLDSKFVLKPPAGFSAYSVDTLVPPKAIGETLPPLMLSGGTGRSESLETLLGGKPALIALLDPDSQPSQNALAVIEKVKDIKILLVSTAPSAKGIRARSLPVFYDPKGAIGTTWHVGATPLIYVLDGKGKITNVWYGFDKNNAGKFATRISDAVSDLSSNE